MLTDIRDMYTSQKENVKKQKKELGLATFVFMDLTWTGKSPVDMLLDAPWENEEAHSFYI